MHRIGSGTANTPIKRSSAPKGFVSSQTPAFTKLKSACALEQGFSLAHAHSVGDTNKAMYMIRLNTQLMHHNVMSLRDITQNRFHFPYIIWETKYWIPVFRCPHHMKTVLAHTMGRPIEVLPIHTAPPKGLRTSNTAIAVSKFLLPARCNAQGTFFVFNNSEKN